MALERDEAQLAAQEAALGQQEEALSHSRTQAVQRRRDAEVRRATLAAAAAALAAAGVALSARAAAARRQDKGDGGAEGAEMNSGNVELANLGIEPTPFTGGTAVATAARERSAVGGSGLARRGGEAEADAGLAARRSQLQAAAAGLEREAAAAAAAVAELEVAKKAAASRKDYKVRGGLCATCEVCDCLDMRMPGNQTAPPPRKAGRASSPGPLVLPTCICTANMVTRVPLTPPTHTGSCPFECGGQGRGSARRGADSPCGRGGCGGAAGRAGRRSCWGSSIATATWHYDLGCLPSTCRQRAAVRAARGVVDEGRSGDGGIGFHCQPAPTGSRG